MNVKKSAALAFTVTAIIVFINFNSYASPPDTSYKAFSTKLIFTETPDIGPKWRGGIRTTDILCWDGYLNVAGWFTFDLFYAGIPEITISDSLKITDNFTMISLKSKPLVIPVGKNVFSLGGGIKYHIADFSEKINGEEVLSQKTNRFVPFITQNFQLFSRNHFNLFSSMALESRTIGNGNKIFTSFCFVPGYRFFITNRWSLGIEYAIFNSQKLPFNLLWFMNDADKLPFYNPNNDWYSLMFWGMSITGRHFRFDLNIVNHYTFQNFVAPLIGFGWNF